MWSLLFSSCRLFVVHGVAGAVYALPALALMFGGVKALQMNAPTSLLVGALVLFIPANTLYVYAATRHMLKNPDSIGFFRAMRWRKEHTDFLLFVSGEIIVLTVLALYFADAVSTLSDKAEELFFESRSAAVKEAALPAINTVLLFGSRAVAVVLLLVALVLWQYLCRMGIRMPAHADGYYLRPEEALSLTRGQTLKMTSLSLLFITAVSTIADAAAAVSTIAGDAPWTGNQALALPVAYFVVMQLHFAMWTKTYQDTTADYQMTKTLF